MGVSGAQQLYSGGFPFETQGKQVEPALEQVRPDRTARPGFFLPEFRPDFGIEEDEIVAEQVDAVFRRVLKATTYISVAWYERSPLYS
jgi:hypothetical protein